MQHIPASQKRIPKVIIPANFVSCLDKRLDYFHFKN